MLKNLAYLAGFTTFMVLLWIFLGIYHNSTNSTISRDAGIQIIPLTPVFDTKTIDALKRRVHVTSDLSETILYPTGVPALPQIGNQVSPTPTPTKSGPTPTIPLATPTTTSVSSESGTTNIANF